MTRLPVTALVLVKNEEAGIAACLERLTAFNEVVVVDSHSEDRTVEIAEAMGARVVQFTWNGSYPKKKQWMLEYVDTKHPWVLYIDADETPTVELVSELEKMQLSDDTYEAAFDIPLIYVFAGQPLKYGHKVYKRALVHKRRVKFPVVDDLNAPGIGEVEGHYQPVPIDTSRPIRALQQRILHDDKDPVRTWFDRHNRYSDWEAYLRLNDNVRRKVASARSPQGRAFDKIPFKPLVFFMYSYVLKRGYLDGRAGFDYAFALASYYWQIGLKVREGRQV